MNNKEITEARRVQIPDFIIGKMAQGYELNEKEKNIVKSKGKVYVLGHATYNGMIKIKPQLRSLPGFALINRLKPYLFKDFLNVSQSLTSEEVEELEDMLDEELEEEYEYYDETYWGVETYIEEEKMSEKEEEKYKKKLKQLEKNIEIIGKEVKRRD